MKLYDYYRSTACYRVRIALHIKQIDYEAVPIHLVNHGGEQHHPDYRRLNPQGLVPTLIDQEQIISQSLPIIEYLDENHPTPPLLPTTALGRAHVRGLAQLIACDMHPLNNLRVLTQLRQQFSANDEQVQSWYHHWLKLGFDAFEAQLRALSCQGLVCYGKNITLADLGISSTL